jgi:nuclear autoantigenic sperm protein
MAAPSSSSAEPGSSSNGTELGKIKEDELKEALNRLIQGKRYLLVKDVASAISSLGEACQILVEVNGPLCAENAEAHFYYGRALLEQSRLDLAVFDGGMPGEKGSSSDSDEEKEGEDEEEEGSDEEGDDDKKDKEDNEAEADGGSDLDKKNKMKTKENGIDRNETAEVKAEDNKKEEEDLNAPSPMESDANADTKPGTTSSEVNVADVSAISNGDKEGEEELSNLELAWEVLEVAKLGYSNQLQLANLQLGEAKTDEEKATSLKTKNSLLKRLAETHSLLGEVATESENYVQAVEDFKMGIKILEEFETPDSREIAQYYFQMGLAFSFGKQFQESIESFKKSKEIIEKRVLNLESKIANKQTATDLGIPLDDPNYTEKDELEELKNLIPELDEKVTDTIDAERENMKTIEEETKEKEIIMQCSPVKNPNPPAANDISHLVKKRKKVEDSLPDPPAKRACNELNQKDVKEVSSSSRNGQNGSSKKTDS